MAAKEINIQYQSQRRTSMPIVDHRNQHRAHDHHRQQQQLQRQHYAHYDHDAEQMMIDVDELKKQ